uniref:Heparan-alpha-glucosaminide N-acetyltransferase n=1 Tax=Timema monikensis TaxID=170555 RepID=A0A7R9EFB7_9NEOP|nr:unnamed protein product [Timema monikensis]
MAVFTIPGLSSVPVFERSSSREWCQFQGQHFSLVHMEGDKHFETSGYSFHSSHQEGEGVESPVCRAEQQQVGDCEEGDFVCELSPDVREFGVYELNVSSSDDHVTHVVCNLNKAKEPVNIYLPLLIWFFILSTLWVMFYLLATLRNRWPRRRLSKLSSTSLERRNETPHKPASSQEASPPRSRLKSLDTFRGLSIVVMIFVNHGGGGYWFLQLTSQHRSTEVVFVIQIVHRGDDLCKPRLSIVVMIFVNHGGGGYWFLQLTSQYSSTEVVFVIQIVHRGDDLCKPRLSIVVMIFVNHGGGGYWFLQLTSQYSSTEVVFVIQIVHRGDDLCKPRLSIVVMIFVNHGGGGYWFLQLTSQYSSTEVVFVIQIVHRGDDLCKPRRWRLLVPATCHLEWAASRGSCLPMWSEFLAIDPRATSSILDTS